MTVTEPSARDLYELALLKARYCRFVDTKQWDAWRALFAPDARIPVSEDGDALGREEFVDLVVGMVNRVRTVHQCSMPELTLAGPGRAHGIWAYRYELEWGDTAPALPFNRLPGQHGFVAFGHYEEDYVHSDDGWRISFLRATQLAAWALVGTAGIVALP
jgi:hypothetical protein